MAQGSPRPITPAARYAIAAALLSFVAWAFGAHVAILHVRFLTVAMLAFLVLGLFLAPFAGLAVERLAWAYESSDVLGGSARLQTVALLGVAAFFAPVLATAYLPGVRLPPLPDPPGRPTLVFSAMSPAGSSEVYLLRGSAKDIQQLTFYPGRNASPALSPDGSQVAFVSSRDGGSHIFVLSVADPASVRRLTEGPGVDGDPAWSPDGKRIAFDSDRSGNRDIWTVHADGGHLADLTAYSPADDVMPAWSPDGTAIAFSRQSGSGAGIWLMTPAGAAPRPLTTGTGIWWATGPQWSMDGSRVCFTGYPLGTRTSDIFTMGVHDLKLARVTTDPGNEWWCHWFDDDRYLWFVSDRPDFGFNFAYYAPSTGGSETLFARA